jgi:transketolase
MARDHNSLKQLAKKIRIHATRMIHTAKSSHLGSNLSMAEIMAVLYGKIMRISPDHPFAPNRDRFILSKGHAAAGYYAVLAECGFFPVDWLDSFYVNGARLAGHATYGIPGIEVSSGALGHGLSMAAGMALAGKRDKASYRIFVVLSDGECDEGSTWEAAMFSAHHHLSNLIAIVDYNKIQALGHTRDVIDLEPFADKWKAFGWAVTDVDGHDIDGLDDALATLPFEPNKPSCLIAHTVKGKGVSFMEDDVLWHYRNPQDEEYENAMQELGGKP